MDALHYLPAHELLRRMADGQLSSEQLTRALLARIREHNPRHAYVQVQRQQQQYTYSHKRDGCSGSAKFVDPCCGCD